MPDSQGLARQKIGIETRFLGHARRFARHNPEHGIVKFMPRAA